MSNQGALDFQAVRVNFYSGSQQGQLIGSISQIALVPGAFLDVTIPWTPSASYLPTEMKVVAIADSANVVVEFDEGNNKQTLVLWSLMQGK